jgi:hypothetical protein
MVLGLGLEGSVVRVHDRIIGLGSYGDSYRVRVI